MSMWIVYMSYQNIILLFSELILVKIYKGLLLVIFTHIVRDIN
jgi:hypothetical protein